MDQRTRKAVLTDSSDDSEATYTGQFTVPKSAFGRQDDVALVFAVNINNVVFAEVGRYDVDIVVDSVAAASLPLSVRLT